MPHTLTLILALCAPFNAAVADQPVELNTEFIRLIADPHQAGTLTGLHFRVKPHNLAGPGGLLQEGFGVANEYVPNRRLNERLELIHGGTAGPILRFSYDCDGPNITGLRVTRTMQPIPGEASIRVTWTVENRGANTHWIAPWVRNEATPGGAVNANTRIDLPTTNGVEQPSTSKFVPAARNWMAITDPSAQETVYAVFNANQLHSFQSIVDRPNNILGVTAWFVPSLISPGETWETVYRLGAVRGLTHVDFATDEMAAQLDYEAGALKLLMSASASLGASEIHASLLHGEAQRLPAKRFNLVPDRLVRCTYDWWPPRDGPYEFLAEIRRAGVPQELGADTQPPHGGIDTQFVVGDRAGNRLEPWTDAPFLLERGPRTLPRAMAATDPAHIWFESSLTKIFPQDLPRPAGNVNPKHRLTLARNEYESFQIVIRPHEDQNLEQIQIQVRPLTQRPTSGASDLELEAFPLVEDATTPSTTLAASSPALPPVSVTRVGYVPVRVPTHFEHPTGLYPDPLLPLGPFTPEAGVCTPLWLTVHAPGDAEPGVYSANITITAADTEPVDLTLEVEVLAFALPHTPTLKTDFGFSLERALRLARARGYDRTAQTLAERYLENAAAHRVTLRELAQLPLPGPSFDAELRAFQAKLPALRAAGVTTMTIQRELLDTPERLKAVQSFAERENLLDTIFCDFAFGPPRHAWPLVINKRNEWNGVAPTLTLMASTDGIDPFIDPAFSIINVHTRVMDTTRNDEILKLISNGHEIWWYVDEAAPRPYANFFLEFEGIEHRVLFWQSWALGVRGLHYGDVNEIALGQNPFSGLLDATPANGNHFLVYPGEHGPLNSIRWDIIRDGIEDHAYLTLLVERVRALRERGGHQQTLERAARLLDVKDIIPDLVNFTREPEALEQRREQIGRVIVEVDQLLGR